MPSLEEMVKMMQALDTNRGELSKAKMELARIAGMEAQLEKNKQGVIEIENSLKLAKKTLADLVKKKNSVVEDACKRAEEAINVSLPLGKSYIEITDKDELLVYYQGAHGLTLYDALSGGEKVMFDRALGVALVKKDEDVLVITEAAELDDDSVLELLNNVADSPVEHQHFVLTCHNPLDYITLKKEFEAQLFSNIKLVEIK